ncbi:MAG: DUF91 domain-containing protein [Haloarculaceae archaeon]
MAAQVQVVAGRCRTEFEHAGETTVREGEVVVVGKPDHTLLVHDADGYQPVAWLTRPASLVVEDDRIEAVDGDQRLQVEVLEAFGRGTYPASEAGRPVGTCPDCEGTLVRAGPRVHCGSCEATYGIPADATVEEEQEGQEGAATCEDCGLPHVSLERGQRFTVCLDASCESYEESVREAYDRAWDCPDCGTDLRVLRRGGLLLGCGGYPHCETSFSFPAGVVVGTCNCGLPRFETATGERCLDPGCDGS